MHGFQVDTVACMSSFCPTLSPLLGVCTHAQEPETIALHESNVKQHMPHVLISHACPDGHKLWMIADMAV